MDIILILITLCFIGYLFYEARKTYGMLKASEATNSQLEERLKLAHGKADEMRGRSSFAQVASTIYTWEWDAHTDQLTIENKAIFLQGNQYISASGSDSAVISRQDYTQSILQKKHRQQAEDEFRKLIEGKIKVFNMKLHLHQEINARTYDWFDVYGTVTSADEQGRALTTFGTAEIIADHEKITESLRLRCEQRKKADKASLGSMARISEKIDGPLNKLVRLMRKRVLTTSPEKIAGYDEEIEHLKQSIMRMNKNSNDLHSLHQGNWMFTKDACDLNIILQASMADFEERREKGKDIETKLKCPANELPALFDVHNIVIIVGHLLDNADKFTPSGTITLGYDQPAGGYVRIYVKDTGMGIAKKKQAHVFDPYFTADNSTKNIGLGLTIADHLTKELGGQIGLTSELGRGSTFWFTVPFRPAISS